MLGSGRRLLAASALALCVTLVGTLTSVQAAPGAPVPRTSEGSGLVATAPGTILPKRPMTAPKGRQVHSKTRQRIRGRAVDLSRSKVKVEVKLYGKYRPGAKRKLWTWRTIKKVRTDAKGRYSFIFKAGGKKWWMRIWAPGDEYYRPTRTRRVQTGFYSG